MKRKKPLIIAHKGGDCFATENSLKAVKASINGGAEITMEINLLANSK